MNNMPISHIYLIFYFLYFCLESAKCHSSSNFNSQNLPVVIWWTESLYPHDGSFSELKCPGGSCTISKRRKYHKKDVPTAYLFYGTEFDAQNLPLPRINTHFWALLHEESPMNNFLFSHPVGMQLFNYTATFSRYSDFPLTTQFLPSVSYLTDRKPVLTAEKNKLRKDGLAPVMYLQSHCNVSSDRDSYVKELMNYIQIDSYGNCLNNKELPAHLLSTSTFNSEDLFEFTSMYKFHLAFENAICDDYITEKLYRALHVGSVPIYKGSPSVRDWVPTNLSVIVADDFQSPKELADFILKLDKSDNLYSQYLQYKDAGVTNEFLLQNLEQRIWGVYDPNNLDFIQSFECFVCEKIQSLKPTILNVENTKRMICPQPHDSVLKEGTHFRTEKWLQQWIENYWFAYDQAKAIELMLKNNDKNTDKFMQYLSQLKYASDL